MATTREHIDSKGKGLLQLLIDNESEMANVMNPSANNQAIYHGPDPDNPVDIVWPKNVSTVGTPVDSDSQYFLREYNLGIRKGN